MPLYDPGTIQLVVLGIPVTGFAKGTFVKVERNERSFKQDVGAQGDVTTIRSRNKSGKITFTTQGTSPSNELLSAALATDELTGLNIGTSFVKDVLGTSIALAPLSRLEGWPATEYGDEASNREWVVICPDLELNVGSGLVVG